MTTIDEVSTLRSVPRSVPHGQRIASVRQLRALLAERGLALLTVAVSLLILVIGGTLVYRAWPILTTASLHGLLTSAVWQPMAGQFGFAPFIAGSVAVTAVAMTFAVVPAILSGVYLAEYMTLRMRTVVKPMLDLLVGIPSVVYGLWGILVIVPLVRDQIGPLVDRTVGVWWPFFRQTNPSGYGLLSAGFVLAVMVFPLIASVTEEVMRTIPREMRETALCLGATRWEATRLVIRRRALSGIMAAVVLGFSRAFGETLAVMMLIGNAVQMPHSLFDSAYPLPALIANNYGEMMSVPLYESALMAAALLLLVIVLTFNVLARFVIVRFQGEAA